MSLKADRREWNDLAQEDAMWAVHSDPQRRGKWTADDFFATGESEIDVIMTALQAQGLRPRAGRALDFGCGLGRLTRALSRRFEAVVGVDASRQMIRDAREVNAGIANCTFELNERGDLGPLPSDSFDFVLSLITLQHVSSRAAIRTYIQEFARVTAPGGIIVFQLPTSVGWRIRLHPLRLINRGLRTLPAAPRWALRRVMGHSMRLVSLPEDEVRALLAASGAPVVASAPDRRTGTPAAPSMSYVARREAAAA
jgi:SAM-dependent methyltransferase